MRRSCSLPRQRRAVQHPPVLQQSTLASARRLQQGASRAVVEVPGRRVAGERRCGGSTVAAAAAGGRGANTVWPCRGAAASTSESSVPHEQAWGASISPARISAPAPRPGAAAGGRRSARSRLRGGPAAPTALARPDPHMFRRELVCEALPRAAAWLPCPRRAHGTPTLAVPAGPPASPPAPGAQRRLSQSAPSPPRRTRFYEQALGNADHALLRP